MQTRFFRRRSPHLCDKLCDMVTSGERDTLPHDPGAVRLTTPPFDLRRCPLTAPLSPRDRGAAPTTRQHRFFPARSGQASRIC